MSTSIVAAAVLAVVIVTRLVWVMGFNTPCARSSRGSVSLRGIRRARRPSAKGGFLIAWCGMRGIVTLAAAFALPQGFPYRDLILLTSFGVVLGTLVIQGLTLRPLVLWLALDDGDPVGHEVGWARRAAFPCRAGVYRRQHLGRG